MEQEQHLEKFTDEELDKLDESENTALAENPEQKPEEINQANDSENKDVEANEILDHIQTQENETTETNNLVDWIEGREDSVPGKTIISLK